MNYEQLLAYFMIIFYLSILGFLGFLIVRFLKYTDKKAKRLQVASDCKQAIGRLKFYKDTKKEFFDLVLFKVVRYHDEYKKRLYEAYDKKYIDDTTFYLLNDFYDKIDMICKECQKSLEECKSIQLDNLVQYKEQECVKIRTLIDNLLKHDIIYEIDQIIR